MVRSDSSGDVRLREAGPSAIDRPRDLKNTRDIAAGYSMWRARIRILFVIDGRIVLSKGKSDFGLGYVLDTLATGVADPTPNPLLAAIPWWVSFEVHIAKRSGDAQDADPHYLRFDSFRFTDAGFDLDGYDQVWFFGDEPNEDDGGDNSTTDADIPGPFALEPAELSLLANWMDRGGGVFATGDHNILGASMCSQIPRVRTMRRWTYKQGVPGKATSRRHETLQPSSGSLEGDTVLQPIEVVYRRAGGGLPFLRPLTPHPLLSSIQGVVDRFPDHMHEGEVIADADVQLDCPLDIPGFSHPEYPLVSPEVLPSAPGNVGVVPQRPRPHVIAYGRTTNRYFPEPLVDSAPIATLAPSDLFGSVGLTKRFGLVGVYDGEPAGVGRVVVDSTWHHWFSTNLVGIATHDTPAYEKMQAYYRNVGLWLSTPAQRQSMLVAGTWGVLVGSPPMDFAANDSPWQIGERVLKILGLTVSPCMLRELVAACLDQKTLAASVAPGELPESEPSWSSLPEDLVNRAVVGGIGSALVDLALAHRAMLSQGQRPRLNAEGIRQRAVDGVARGHALLRKSVHDAAAALGAVHATLTASPMPRPIDVRIPIDVRRLRVVAETLQFPDPGDPALMGDRITVTIRIRLDDDVVAHRILEGVELPAFEARGAVLHLSRDLGPVEVQAGESLSIEVLVGSWTAKEVNPEVIRFKDTLRGDASEWIGKRIPARSQAWRLWYRIEDAKEPS